MVHLDHFVLAAQDLYEASFRLRKETNLGFYDGGWTEAGMASKIFPLGGGSYIQLESLVNPFYLQDPSKPGAKRFYESVSSGDRITGLSLRVDSLEELNEIAKQHKFTVTANSKTGRIRPDGERIGVAGTPSAGETAPKGMPNWYYFTDITAHPSGQPVEAAPRLVKPLGIAWAEMGGTEAEMTTWLGMPASSLPFRFNGKDAGLYAVGVQSDKGEIVIRRKSLSER